MDDFIDRSVEKVIDWIEKNLGFESFVDDDYKNIIMIDDECVEKVFCKINKKSLTSTMDRHKMDEIQEII